MTEDEIATLAEPIMKRMAEMGVPRCEATEEAVARVITHPHGRIYVCTTDEQMTILVKTWDK